MGATYTRQSASAIVDGGVIEASDLNAEFNQILAAFAVTSGHTHDGTTAEGGPITKLLGTAITIGDATAGTDIAVTFDGESADGVLTWKEDEDYFEFSDDLLLATTEKLQFRDTAIYINSSADGQLDLVADTEIQIAATTIDINGLVDISGNLSVGGNLDVTGSFDMSDANITNIGSIALDTITNDGTDITLDSSGDIILDADGADIFLKDAGTTYGSLTNSSGNLIVKSGTTTAATFSGANVTLAGTVGSGAITSTGIGTLAVTGIATFTDDILLGDSNKAIFGAGSDLEIFHNGSNSYISDNGTGDLYIRGSSQIRLTNTGASENYAVFNDNGAVSLYHDNSKKFDTTSGGVAVTGDLTATGNLTTLGIDDNADALAMTIDSSERVGIGTTSPSEKLEVRDGKLLVKTTSGAATIEIVSPGGTSDSVLNFGDSDDNNVGAIAYEHDNNAFRFLTNASERMRITSAGFLGIGTTAPTHNLTVDGGTSTSVSLIKDASGSATIRYYDGGSQKSYIQLDASENMEFYAASGVEQVFYGNNAEVMRLSSGAVFNEVGGDRDFRVESNNNANMLFVDGGNDKVGIGTSSPGTGLQVNQDWVSDYGSINVSHSTNSLGGLGIRCNNAFKAALIYKGGTTGALLDLGTYAAEPIIFRTNNAERVRIDSAGKVMIGTTTAAGILKLDNTGQTSETLLTTEDTGGSGAHSHITLKNTTGTVASLLTNSDNLEFRVDDETVFANISGTEHMRITSGGSVGIGTSSPNGELHVVSSATTNQITFENTDGGAASAPDVVLFRNSASPADGDDLGRIHFRGKTDTGAENNYAYIYAISNDVSNGSEDGSLFLGGLIEGADRSWLSLKGTEVVVNDSSNDMDFRVESNANTHALFVEGSTNRVGIGTDDPSYSLHVEAGAAGMARVNYNLADSATTFYVSNGSSASGSTDETTNITFLLGNGAAVMGAYKISDTETGANRDIGLQFATQENNSVANHFRIDHQGTLTATDTSIGSISDIRLKKDITNFTYNIDTFKSLKPRKFNWKNAWLHGNETNRLGFIAQELKTVDEYWVSEQKTIRKQDDILEPATYYKEGDNLPSGKSIGDLKTETTYTYKYEKGDGSDYDLLNDGSNLDNIEMIAKLGKKDAMYVSVIQQLITKIETLETKVKTLEDA